LIELTEGMKNRLTLLQMHTVLLI